MNKIYRILGKKGRTTIPFEMRQELGFSQNDVVSFTVQDNKTVLVKREKLCDDCAAINLPKPSPSPLLIFLDTLSVNEQRVALAHLYSKMSSKNV